MPRKPAALPPDTRQFVSYDEGAAWWSSHHREISPRQLRRIPLETRLIGRNRLILFSSLRAAAAAELAVPPVLFQAAPARPAHHRRRPTTEK